MLAVLMPYRAGQRPQWSAERGETETSLGVRITRNGKSMSVVFPKPGKDGTVRVQGN